MIPDTLDTAEDRLQFVVGQVRDFQRGLTRSMQCPYCCSANHEGAVFCCDKMMLAVGAAIDRMELTERLEEAERIADRTN